MPPATQRESGEAVVSKTILLNCPQAHAFRVFTERMGAWWPATHHVGSVPFKEILIEPRCGGRWYEIDANEQQGLWGHVLAWEPPSLLALSWHLNAKFEFDPDMDHASRLDISFKDLGAGQTRVDFLHTGIERHGDGYQALRDQLDRGWVGVLGQFARLAESSARDASFDTASNEDSSP
jgi:uncharacterized protein YndB with AHSA1/START domain